MKFGSDIPKEAMAKTSLSPQNIYDPNLTVTITLSEGLSDLQMKLLLAHEYWHVSLYEISVKAGSYQQLQIDDPALAYQIDLKGVNSGHHNYMTTNMDEYEAILREAFPGESEDFYKYGKWGGGPMNEIGAFYVLSVEEQVKIDNYLKANGLKK